MNDYRRIRTGRGQANLGQGNQNIGRDQIDRRVDNRHYRQVHNHGMYAERDLNYRDGDYYDVQHGQADPFYDIAGGRGVGRLIAAFGLLIALIGFGAWAYPMFLAMSSGAEGFNPWSLKVRGGIPLLVVGFVAFGFGGLITAIGGAMARAARRRHDRAMYYRRRRRF